MFEMLKEIFNNVSKVYGQGHSDGSEEGYSSGYSFGYDEGYSSGYSFGYDEGYSSGYSFGYNSGYSDGYNSVGGGISNYIKLIEGKYVTLTADDLKGATAIGVLFSSVPNLAGITIPGSVRFITSFAFSYCAELNSVTICDGLESIGYGAFSHCAQHGAMTVDFSHHTSVPTLEADVFDGTRIDRIIVPAELLDEWKAATNWSEYAEYIVAG